MPLKTHEAEPPSLNLTPMIDVVFLLIIFFMVGTKFYDIERQFDVELPEVAEAGPLTSPPEEIIINVHRDGQLVVRSQELTLAELVGLLRHARQQYIDQAVLVRGDRYTPYQRIAEVLAACTQAEIRHINLSAKLQAGAASQDQPSRLYSRDRWSRTAAVGGVP